MIRSVLVHGAWDGGWCWSRVVSLLRTRGHDCDCPDLPGRNEDRRHARDITLTDYVSHVAQVVSTGPASIVVGHSLGGVVIQGDAKLLPDSCISLVFVSGMLVPNNHSLFDAFSQATDSSLAGARIFDASGSVMSIDLSAAREAFYGRCSSDDATMATSRLVPEPVRPCEQALRTTNERFGTIARYYIMCTEDRAVPLSLQQRMVATSPCRQTFSMASDHSPFLSFPEKLASLLHDVAALERQA